VIRVLALVVLLVLPEVEQRTRLQPDFNIFTVAQDIELGRIAAQEMESQSVVLQNSDVSAYLNTLGNTLTAKTPQSSPFHFEWRVINDRSVNAFGLPGGIVYLNRGAIETSANEAQLASVVAHEIAHVVLRHGSHQLSKVYSLQLPVSSLGAIGRISVADALTKTSGSFGASSILLKNPREAEDQADIMSVQIIYDAGYDPEAAVRLFEALEAQSKLLKTPVNHPETVKRIMSVKREIAKLGNVRGAVILDSPQFQSIKAILLTLP
jgi:predicted Zn-dependent protease